MDRKKAIYAGLALVLVVLVGGYFIMSISYSNTEIRLRNQIAAQQDANAVIYDKVWKVIAQKAQVTEKAKDSFKEMYVPLMEGRYARGGSFMKWIKEHNPQFDFSLFKDLMNSIEALRAEFANVQIRLRDLKREHDNLIGTFPGSWFLSDRKPIKVQLVTSGQTQKTFETGEENEINVFK